MRVSYLTIRLVIVLASVLSVMATVQAANIHIPGLGGGFYMSAQSLKQRLNQAKWETTIRQQYDFSCGSAAVATLLTYHYGMPTTEAEVFKAMFRHGNKQKIRAQGFSMLDMKRYLDSRGLHSAGFRMSLDDIAKIGVPVIALVNTKGYQHFVVIKGVKATRVLVGDPAVGTTIVSRKYFKQIWNGEVLAARAHIATARAHFNVAAVWSSVTPPQAPLAQGIDRTGLGLFTLTLPGRNAFGR